MFCRRLLIVALLVQACASLSRFGHGSGRFSHDDGSDALLSVLRNFVHYSQSKQQQQQQQQRSLLRDKEALDTLLSRSRSSESCENCWTSSGNSRLTTVTDAPAAKRTDTTGMIGGTLLHPENILKNMIKMELVNRKLEQLKATGDIYEFIHGISA